MAVNFYKIVTRQEVIFIFPSKYMVISPLLLIRKGSPTYRSTPVEQRSGGSRSFRKLIYSVQRLPISELTRSHTIANQIAIAKHHAPQPVPVCFPILALGRELDRAARN